VLVLTDVISRPYPGLSVVPDRCTATYDRRTLPGESEEDVLAPIRQAVARALAGGEAQGTVLLAEDDFQTYTGAHVRAPNFAPAWYLEPDSAPVRLLAGALEGAGLPLRFTHYAFCTNGSATAGRLGIPTVGFGPGAQEMAHRVDEQVQIEQLGGAARGYAAIAAEALRRPLSS
jgi:acetylornithine deacetylase/succinyl-diaminopimelate desuccinylase-like protein